MRCRTVRAEWATPGILEALIPGRMQGQAAQKKYPDELRERAVKMVLEIREREGKGRGELARVARQLKPWPSPCRPPCATAETFTSSARIVALHPHADVSTS